MNFARSPLPTLAVWIGDALSGLGLALYGRAVEWRMKRQASRRLWVMAAVDLAILALAAIIIVAVL